MADNITVTDSTGRKIVLRVMTPGAMLDVYEAAEESSTNGGYVRFASLICSLFEIDGVPVPMPRDKKGIRALGEKLGNEGLAACYAALYPDDTVAATSAESIAATAKN